MIETGIGDLGNAAVVVVAAAGGGDDDGYGVDPVLLLDVCDCFSSSPL